MELYLVGMSFYFFCLIGVSFGQSDCIFGDSSDCYFPCACERALNATVACDTITGHCYSGNCIDGYTLTVVGTQRICERRTYSYREIPANLYLVDPMTKERLTENLVINNSSFRIIVEDDCRPLLSSPTNAFTGSYTWELEFENIFEFYHIKLSTSHSCGYIDCGQARVEISSEAEITHTFADCYMEREYYVTCNNEIPFIANRIYVTFPTSTIKCISIFYLQLYNVRQKLNIDCSKCEQQDAYPSCGNGLWCERCSDGWRAPDCLRPCEPGFYGINCSDYFSYDWSGLFHIIPSGTGFNIDFKCEVDIPHQFRDDVQIEIQYAHNISEHVFDSWETVPFTNNMTSLLIENTVTSLTSYFRMTLILNHRNVSYYGTPSVIIGTFFPEAERQKGSSDTGSNANWEGLVIGLSLASIILLILCAVICIYFQWKVNCLKISRGSATTNRKTPSVAYVNTDVQQETGFGCSLNATEQSNPTFKDSSTYDNIAEIPNENEFKNDTIKEKTDVDESIYQGTYENLKGSQGDSLYDTLES